MPKGMSIMDRFWNKVEKQENGCWVWIGSKCAKGYGHFRAWEKPMQAHRFSYEVHRGPIPPYTPNGLQLDHYKCDNTSCVNPEHMKLVLPRENMLRGNNMAARYAKRTHCAKGHELTVCEVNGRRCDKCRAAYPKRNGKNHNANQRAYYQRKKLKRESLSDDLTAGHGG